MEATQVSWGQVDPAELLRIVVLSPHFDDAAMGAGQMLIRHCEAETAVITVLGGRPPFFPDPPSAWDALGGFRAGARPGGERLRAKAEGDLVLLEPDPAART